MALSTYAMLKVHPQSYLQIKVVITFRWLPKLTPNHFDVIMHTPKNTPWGLVYLLHLVDSEMQLKSYMVEQKAPKLVQCTLLL